MGVMMMSPIRRMIRIVMMMPWVMPSPAKAEVPATCAPSHMPTPTSVPTPWVVMPIPPIWVTPDRRHISIIAISIDHIPIVWRPCIGQIPIKRAAHGNSYSRTAETYQARSILIVALRRGKIVSPFTFFLYDFLRFNHIAGCRGCIQTKRIASVISIHIALHTCGVKHNISRSETSR